MKFDPEATDKRIREFGSSSKTPSEFMEAELRRIISRDLLTGGNLKYLDEILRTSVPFLEQEYRCYFDRESFVEGLEHSLQWEFVFAGANAQVSGLIKDNNGFDDIEKLGFGSEKVSRSDLNDKVSKFLIGIGYLFPVEDSVIVHPNMLFAQTNPRFYSGDTEFLTRDLIRGPYLELKYDRNLTSAQEFWGYWKDLVALAAGNLTQEIIYSSANFKGLEQPDPEISSALELGRKLVPRRYIQLEPELEKFDWIIPE